MSTICKIFKCLNQKNGDNYCKSHEEDYRCSICMEDITNRIYVGECLHFYCKSCVDILYIKNDDCDRCPLCRGFVDIFDIYNKCQQKIIRIMRLLPYNSHSEFTLLANVLSQKYNSVVDRNRIEYICKCIRSMKKMDNKTKKMLRNYISTYKKKKKISDDVFSYDFYYSIINGLKIEN